MSQFNKLIRQPKIWLAMLAIALVLAVSSAMSQKRDKEKALNDAVKIYQHLEEQISQQDAQNKVLNQQLTVLQQQKLLQEETLLNLRSYVEGLQGENAALADNADVYQSLIQEDRKANNLTVRKFKLYATPKPDRIRYSLILSKIGLSNNLVEGEVDLAVHGKLGDKLLSLPVQHVNLPEHQGLRYNFKYFQELSGELDIPDGFQPTHMSVRVLPQGAAKPTLEEWFNWGLQPQVQADIS